MSGEKKVALLAEGVDRNSYEVDTKTGPLTSPSSRRAWIEIISMMSPYFWAVCRPPRGGRG